MQDSAMKQCIEACLDCNSACLETFSYCLGLGGKHREEAHLRLLLDCAEICRTSADFMLRGSGFHVLTCDLCAEICERCADDCAQFRGDQHMTACAESCRRCASECRQMAQAAAA